MFLLYLYIFIAFLYFVNFLIKIIISTLYMPNVRWRTRIFCVKNNIFIWVIYFNLTKILKHPNNIILTLVRFSNLCTRPDFSFALFSREIEKNLNTNAIDNTSFHSINIIGLWWSCYKTFLKINDFFKSKNMIFFTAILDIKSLHYPCGNTWNL